MNKDFLEKIAQPYYSSNENHFHNFSHAKNVRENAIKIIKKMGRPDLEEELSLSAVFHDAGYHMPEAYNFNSKEDYSIDILKNIAIRNNIDEKTLLGAIEGIEGTKIDQEDFEHKNRKIMRAADINNLGEEFEDMLTDTIKVYNEYSFLNKIPLTEKGIYPLPRNLFREKQSEILHHILEITKKNIPEEYFTRRDFYNNTTKNIELLSKAYQPKNLIQ